MYNIYLSWNSAYQSIFAKPPCHTAAAEKNYYFFLSLLRSPSYSQINQTFWQ